MRSVSIVAVALAACGAKQPSAPPPSPVGDVGPPIALEWKAEQADGGRVDVSLMIDGTAQHVGLLDAQTDTEAGTPATCALRAAYPLRSEFQCGAGNYYAAELHAGELVITLDDGAAHAVEVKRLPVDGDRLAVRPYAL
jgi:hypothetical protein